MTILDGKKIKEEKLIELKKEINLLNKKPGIAIIQIGDEDSSNIYVKNKKKTAEELGINFNVFKFMEDDCENNILNKIEELNNDNTIDGIIVQMPIPTCFNSSIIKNKIIPKKDIDSLTDINTGCLMHNKNSFIPCTPKGIMTMLNYYNIEIKGKHIVIIGRSELVGKPLLSLMLNNDATVSICHSYTSNLKNITILADILIVAVGKPNLVTNEMIKDGAIVIDVGVNRENGKIVGDVDFNSVKDKCSYITPVPGGIGQMTVLSLYENLLKAYRNNN